jgi:hypothetical protein
MNTEVDFSVGSAQHAWLERELSNIDRTKTPWVVFGGHRPGIIDSTDSPENRPTPPAGMMNPSDLTVMSALQEHVWGPLLAKYNVSLAFWGHNHAYQRSCAWRTIGQGLFNASDGCVAYSKQIDGVSTYVEPGAPVSILVGTAGASLTRNGNGQEFTEKRLHNFGYVRLTSVNRTHLYGEYQEAGSGYGDVLDKFMIVQADPIGTSHDDLARALADLETWRSITYVMAAFVCVTITMSAWLMQRHWRTATARGRMFQMLHNGEDL